MERAGRWLGLVVPKRHARRAVTRNLIRRQVRAEMARRVGGLPAGWWVVRLKAGFDPRRFPSAASDALKREARSELQQLMDKAIGRCAGATARSNGGPAGRSANPGQHDGPG